MSFWKAVGGIVDAFTGGADFGIGSIIGGAIDSSNASSAANRTTQSGVSSAGATLQNYLDPYVQAGLTGVNQLLLGSKPGGQFNKPFTMADAQNMPAYQFALNEGLGQIGNRAAAVGGAGSVNAQRDMINFAEGTAAQYENQAFNQWLQQNQLALNSNQFLSQLGGTAAMSLGNDLANLKLIGTGSDVGNIKQQAGITSNLANSISGILPSIISPSTGGYGGNGAMPVTPSVTAPDSFDTSGLPDLSTNIPDIQFSDRRLKSDIKPVGKTFKGQTIYKYRMGGEPSRMGVMADETPREAVSPHKSGFLMVDYDKVQ